MSLSTNKNILVIPGSLGGFSTSISQVDFKWYESGFGTFIFTPNLYDLRSSVYNWYSTGGLTTEPGLLFGGVGTLSGTQYAVAPYQDYTGAFSGISTFPTIQMYPVSGRLYANIIGGNTINISSVNANSLKLTGQIYDVNNSAGLNAQILSSTGAGIEWISPSGGGNISGTLSAPQIPFTTESNTLSGVSTFVFSNLGNVGIGTSTPTQSAHIQGGFRLSGGFYDGVNSSGGQGQVLSSNSGVTSWINVSSGSGSTGTIGGFIQPTQISYGSGANSITGVSTFVFSNLGNVGIGTSTPTQSVHIQAGLRLSGPHYDGLNSAGGVNQILSSSGGATTWINAALFGFGTGIIGGQIQPNQISYGIGNNSIGGANTFVFSNLGNVGVGTSTPTQSLQVQGTFRLSGAFYDGLNSSGGIGQVLSSEGGVTTWINNVPNITDTASTTQIVYSNGPNSLTGVGTFVFSGLGNVGVGTITPTQSLHVQNGLRLSGAYYDGLNSSGGQGQILSSNSGVTTWINSAGIAATGTIGGFIQPAQIPYGSGSNSVTGVSTFVFSNLGNVGIGTSAPTQSAHIQGTFRLSGAYYDGLNSSGGIGQVLSSQGGVTTWINNVPGIIDAASSAQIVYSNGANSLTGVSTFVFSGLGNVGIGTITPTQSLHVQSGFRLTGAYYDGLNSSGGQGQILSSNSGVTTWINGAGIAATGTIGGFVQPTQITYGSGSNSITGVSTFVFSQLGFVGVGTTAPTQYVHIQGGVRLSGGFYDGLNSSGGQNQILSSSLGVTTWINATSFGFGTGIIGGFVQPNQIVYGSGSNSITGVSTFVFSNLGNVGIGTSTPTQSVHIQAGLRLGGGFYDGVNSSGGQGQVLSSSNGVTTWINVVSGSGSTGTIGGFIQPTQISYGSGSNSVTGVSTFVFSNLGNVGIGTSTPTQSAHIQGTFRLSGAYYDGLNSSGGIGQVLSSQGGVTTWINNVPGIIDAASSAQIVYSNGANSLTGVSTFVFSNLGNVGIGTITPTQSLHVQNGFRLSGAHYDGLNSSGGQGQILSSNFGVTTWINNVPSITDSANSTQIVYSNGSNSLTGVSTFVFSGLGNVGIGTITPTQSLHVQSGFRLTGAHYDGLNSSGGQGQILSSNSGVTTWVNGAGIAATGTIGGFVQPNQIVYGSGSNSITGVSTFVFSQLGFVGVGTTTPTQSLHVQSGFRLSGAHYDGLNSSGGQGQILSSNSGVTTWINGAGIAATGTIGGFVQPTQISYGSGSNSLTGVATFVFSGLGNVGIGTVTPTQSLHVQSGFRLSGAHYDGLNSSGGQGQILSSNSGVTTWINNVPSITDSATSTQIVYANGANSLTGVSTFVFSGLGNVGIGTVTPTQSAHIQAGLRLGGGFYDGVNSSGGQGQVLSSSNGVTTWINVSSGGGSGSTGTIGGFVQPNQIVYGVGANSITGLSTFVYIPGIGSVGIGTSTPTQSLHVQGTARLTNSLYDVNNIPGTNAQVLTATGVGVSWASFINFTDSATNAQIVYSGGAYALAGVSTFVFSSLGNVGIGTSTPTQSLHVQNATRLSGGLYDGNNLPGSYIGVVTQFLSSANGITSWQPVKRSIVATLMTGFTPTGLSTDNARFIVPYDPNDGVTNVNFTLKRVSWRVETASTLGYSTINLYKYSGIGTFSNLGFTSVLATNLTMGNNGTQFEIFTNTFNAGSGTTASSGDKYAINVIGLSTYHTLWTVEMLLRET